MVKKTEIPLSVTDTTIFEQLKKEHDDLKQLLVQTARAGLDERKDLLRRVAKELVPHARGEEKTLYAVLRQRALKQNLHSLEIANEGYEEHRVADGLLAELKKLTVDDERWLPLFKVLKENLYHHIHEEEHLLWASVRELFSFDEQKKLLGLYMSAKERYAESMPDQMEIRAREPLAEVSAVL